MLLLLKYLYIGVKNPILSEWYLFCRLITKIITLKKELNELRKQQVLTSTEER